MSPAPRHLVAVDAPESATSTVVLAEGHPLMRHSLRRVLEASPRIEVAAEAGDLALTRQHLAGHRPDVLVLDVNMPDGSSFQLLEELHEQAPDLQVVMISADDTPGFARRGLAAGARAFVLKEHADEELPDAIAAAARGETYLSPAIARRLAEMRRSPAGERLSARETDVLRLIAFGHTNVEIAAQLGVAPRTVETRRGHIQRKLGLRTRAELVRHALDCGLLET